MARAVSILKAVARSPSGLTPPEISDLVGLGRQGTYHLLHTLTETGLLSRLDRHRYVVGLQAALLADALGRQVTLPEHLVPYTRELSRVSGETTYVAGWWEDEIAVLGLARGALPVEVIDQSPGYAGDAHARASGKLLLALAEPERRDEYLASHDLDPRTSQTITSRDELLEALEVIREQGWAVDLEEFSPGLCCLAVTIAEQPRLALCLSAPTKRFRENFQRNLQLARETARRVPEPGSVGDTASVASLPS